MRLRRYQSFESFLLELSAAFARAPAEDIAAEIDTWLERLASFVGADRCTLWELSESADQVRLLHRYARPGLDPPKVNGAGFEMPWLTRQYRRGKVVVWSRIPDDIPRAAVGERAWAEHVGAKSVLCIPFSSGTLTRSLVLVSVRSHRRWQAALIRRLRLVAEIFSSAITASRAVREIEERRQELSQFGRAALVGQLMSSLAHDLAQPLSAALSNAQACQKLFASDIRGEDFSATLDDIVSSCRLAGRTIERVRALLRTERRAHQSVDLNRLVRDVAAVMRSDFCRREVQLLMKLNPAMPRISADPVELQHVILNLMLNAAEAMGSRPSVLRRVSVETASANGEVKLTIRDCGPGTQPENLRRIFEPFFTTKEGSVGMGLAICSEIVRSHGGRLCAENNTDDGMTVHCVLPRTVPSR